MGCFPATALRLCLIFVAIKAASYLGTGQVYVDAQNFTIEIVVYLFIIGEKVVAYLKATTV